MAKRDLLKLPDDLDGNLRALLNTAPPPHSTPGSRKVAPKAAPEAERQAANAKLTRARAAEREGGEEAVTRAGLVCPSCKRPRRRKAA